MHEAGQILRRAQRLGLFETCSAQVRLQHPWCATSARAWFLLAPRAPCLSVELNILVVACGAGIAWLLKLLLRDVTPLPELVAHACYLLSNLVVVEPKLQERAREQRAFEIISRYLQVRSPTKHTVAGAVRSIAFVAMPFDVLTSVGLPASFPISPAACCLSPAVANSAWTARLICWTRVPGATWP